MINYIFCIATEFILLIFNISALVTYMDSERLK